MSLIFLFVNRGYQCWNILCFLLINVVVFAYSINKAFRLTVGLAIVLGLLILVGCFMESDLLI